MREPLPLDLNDMQPVTNDNDVPTKAMVAFVLQPLAREPWNSDDPYMDFVAALSREGVIVYRTRKHFIRWCAETFHAMCNGKLFGVGDCIVIIGQRGVGKSYMLRKVLAAARALMPRTMVCYMQYKAAARHETPLRILLSQLPVAWQSIGSIAQLYATLERHQLYLVFAVDELDSVFLGADANDKEILAQLMQISEMDAERRIVVIATGSSCLRRLCFQAGNEDDRAKYRAYSGKSFNDRKYTCLTLGTLQDADEVEQAVSALNGPHTPRSLVSASAVVTDLSEVHAAAAAPTPAAMDIGIGAAATADATIVSGCGAAVESEGQTEGHNSEDTAVSGSRRGCKSPAPCLSWCHPMHRGRSKPAGVGAAAAASIICKTATGSHVAADVACAAEGAAQRTC